jgi:hypothetical protein
MERYQAKLVAESLEAIMEFQRGQNPSDVLKLGKKKELEAWLKQHIFKSAYRINSDWTVDLKRDFIIPKENFMPELPEYVQFNECFGDFLIRDQNLISMIGCPYVVHGDFMVDGNKLTDLKGSPTRVDGSYFIKRNSVKFTKEQIQKICEVGEMIIV